MLLWRNFYMPRYLRDRLMGLTRDIVGAPHLPITPSSPQVQCHAFRRHTDVR